MNQRNANIHFQSPLFDLVHTSHLVAMRLPHPISSLSLFSLFLWRFNGSAFNELKVLSFYHRKELKILSRIAMYCEGQLIICDKIWSYKPTITKSQILQYIHIPTENLLSFTTCNHCVYDCTLLGDLKPLIGPQSEEKLFLACQTASCKIYILSSRPASKAILTRQASELAIAPEGAVTKGQKVSTEQ